MFSSDINNDKASAINMEVAAIGHMFLVCFGTRCRYNNDNYINEDDDDDDDDDNNNNNHLIIKMIKIIVKR